jgi:hypothetical protein
VVDSEIEDRMSAWPLKELIKKDEAGIPFINYLYICSVTGPVFESNVIFSLAIHKRMIETQLLHLRDNKSSQAILNKYRWLGKYHNAVVNDSERLTPNKQEFLISDELLAHERA